MAGGAGRDDAYRIVQERALQAWESGQSFRALLESDERVTMSASQMDDAFDLVRSLRHSGRVVDSLVTVATPA